jgi:hypothetical protein
MKTTTPITATIEEMEMKPAGAPPVIKILTVLIVLVLIVIAVLYLQLHTLQQDPNQAAQAKITALVTKVNMLIDLPTGETPVVAEVTDLAPLTGNPFFAKAKVGDEVLLYPVAKQAFLYDPSANIIVEVASLNIGK